MTIDEIIDGIIDREGEGKPPYIVPGDRGGRTRWGISERWHPDAWEHGPPSRELAKTIYVREYVQPWSWVPDVELQVQLIDWGVLHGIPRTLHWLMRLGMIHPATMGSAVSCLGRISPIAEHPWMYKHINNALVAGRLKLIDDLTDEEKSQKKFEEGWENRALHFLVTR